MHKLSKIFEFPVSILKENAVLPIPYLVYQGTLALKMTVRKRRLICETKTITTSCIRKYSRGHQLDFTYVLSLELSDPQLWS